jgi:hypothetical protein
VPWSQQLLTYSELNWNSAPNLQQTNIQIFVMLQIGALIEMSNAYLDSFVAGHIENIIVSIAVFYC